MSDDGGLLFVNLKHGRFVKDQYANLHEAHRPPHVTIASKLHGGDRPMSMIANGGRSSQPLVIRHIDKDGKIPFAPEINVDYYPTGKASKINNISQKRVKPIHRPSVPEVPDFSQEDVVKADSDKLKKYLGQIGQVTGDMPFYDRIMAENGDDFKNDARKMAMHWAVLYNQNPLTAKAEMSAWMQNTFDPEPLSAVAYLDFWTAKVQADIAAGSTSNSFLGNLSAGEYMSDDQKAVSGIFDFSSISDDWNHLKTNYGHVAGDIASKFQLTGAGGGYQALPNQVIAPSIYSVSATAGDGYSDSTTAFSEALGAALVDIRYQFLNPPVKSDSGVLLLVGGVAVAGLVAYWLLK